MGAPSGLVGHDGIPLSYVVWGDPPRAALFVHATGFCKEVWGPVLDRLPGVGAVLLDERGHGESGTPPLPIDWWDLGRDVLSLIDRLDGESLLGVGHSSGGAALVIAELLAPGTFSGMVLVEPIILPGEGLDMPIGRLAEGARRRRSHFDSVAEAHEWFHGRGPFAGWDEGALRAYVEHGTVDDGQGGRVLACQPEVEAAWYEASPDDRAWRRLAEVRCPVTIVGGAASSHLPAGFVSELAGRFPDAEEVVVPGVGHFAPQQDPAAIAAIIERRMTGG